jgi:CDP-paratose 2-epimerase
MGKVDQGVVSLWVLRHYFGKPLSYIGYGGAGKQVRDVLHVDDLCELVEEQFANFTAWDGWLGNVSGGLGNSTSLQELTAICRQIIGRQTTIGKETTNRQADLRLFMADCHRLFARTAWRPHRDVKQTVADIFNWVRAHEKELQPLV